QVLRSGQRRRRMRSMVVRHLWDRLCGPRGRPRSQQRSDNRCEARRSMSHDSSSTRLRADRESRRSSEDVLWRSRGLAEVVTSLAEGARLPAFRRGPCVCSTAQGELRTPVARLAWPAGERRQRDVCRTCDVLLVPQVAHVYGYLPPAVQWLEAGAQVEEPIRRLRL